MAASIFDNPDLMRMLLAMKEKQDAGLPTLLDSKDVNPTGVAPTERQATTAPAQAPATSQTLTTSEYTGEAELPPNYSDADMWAEIQAINERAFNPENLERIRQGVFTPMQFSPEMAERQRELGMDVDENGMWVPPPALLSDGSETYTRTQAKEDIEAALRRGGYENAADLKYSVRGSHNDIYPNLGPAGNMLYTQGPYKPRGGPERAPSGQGIQQTSYTDPVGYAGGFSETGKRERGVGFDIATGIVDLFVPGVGTAFNKGINAASGNSLHKDDYVDLGAAGVAYGADKYLKKPAIPPVEVDPTILNIADTAQTAEEVKEGIDLYDLIDIGRKGYEIYKNIEDDKEDEPPTIVWQDPDISDTPGDVQVQIPDYDGVGDGEPNPGDEGTDPNSGGKAADEGDAGDTPKGEEPADDGTDTPEQPTEADDDEHEWVYKGNGEFENKRTGQVYVDPEFSVYGEDEYPAVIGEDYSINEEDIGGGGEDPTPPTDDLPPGYIWVLVNGEWDLQKTSDQPDGGDPDGADDGTGSGNEGDGPGSGDQDDGGGKVPDGPDGKGPGEDDDGPGPITGFPGEGPGGDGTGGDGEDTGDDDGPDQDMTGTFLNLLMGGQQPAPPPAPEEKDPTEIDFYDWEGIFRHAAQEAKYPRPYDSPQKRRAQQEILNMSRKDGKLPTGAARGIVDLMQDKMR